jgi:hypothetical protein
MLCAIGSISLGQPSDETAGVFFAELDATKMKQIRTPGLENEMKQKEIIMGLIQTSKKRYVKPVTS